MRGNLAALVVQIALIDIVFSLDSVFTAVGLVKELPVMVAAIVVAILVMMWVSGRVGAFIARHPTIKMLALAFLLLIGVALVAAGPALRDPEGLPVLRHGVRGGSGADQRAPARVARASA